MTTSGSVHFDLHQAGLAPRTISCHHPGLSLSRRPAQPMVVPTSESSHGRYSMTTFDPETHFDGTDGNNDSRDGWVKTCRYELKEKMMDRWGRRKPHFLVLCHILGMTFVLLQYQL